MSRFRALSGEDDFAICEDSMRFSEFYATNPGITDLNQLRDNANMGRLNVTRATGLSEDGSCYEGIYAFGARSLSAITRFDGAVIDFRDGRLLVQIWMPSRRRPAPAGWPRCVA